MSAAYLDATVLVHALGADPELGPACQHVLDLVERKALRGETAVLAIDEVVHVRHRRSGNRAQAVKEGRAFAAALAVHDVTGADLERALDLFAKHGSLNMRDAIHAAVATRAGLSMLIATDSDFDDVPGLRRIDPRERAAIEEALAG